MSSCSATPPRSSRSVKEIDGYEASTRVPAANPRKALDGPERHYAAHRTCTFHRESDGPIVIPHVRIRAEGGGQPASLPQHSFSTSKISLMSPLPPLRTTNKAGPFRAGILAAWARSSWFRRGISSVGRAFEWHSKGRRFEPDTSTSQPLAKQGVVAFLADPQDDGVGYRCYPGATRGQKQAFRPACHDASREPFFPFPRCFIWGNSTFPGIPLLSPVIDRRGLPCVG